VLHAPRPYNSACHGSSALLFWDGLFVDDEGMELRSMDAAQTKGQPCRPAAAAINVRHSPLGTEQARDDRAASVAVEPIESVSRAAEIIRIAVAPIPTRPSTPLAPATAR
jgi:hypothetical protein